MHPQGSASVSHLASVHSSVCPSILDACLCSVSPSILDSCLCLAVVAHMNNALALSLSLVVAAVRRYRVLSTGGSVTH